MAASNTHSTTTSIDTAAATDTIMLGSEELAMHHRGVVNGAGLANTLDANAGGVSTDSAATGSVGEEEDSDYEAGRLVGGSQPGSAAANPADTAEWQATIEGVVKSVVSIQFCQTHSFDTDSAVSSEATGFVVDAERGYILTNRVGYHMRERRRKKLANMGCSTLWVLVRSGAIAYLTITRRQVVCLTFEVI